MLFLVFLVSYLGPTRDWGPRLGPPATGSARDYCATTVDLLAVTSWANLIPIFQFFFKIKMNSYSATRHQR